MFRIFYSAAVNFLQKFYISIYIDSLVYDFSLNGCMIIILPFTFKGYFK